MKKINLLLCLLFVGLQSIAQVTTLGNTTLNPTTDYVGWNSGITNALRIKHEGNYGIEFYTNTSAFSSPPKMMLNAAGYLGIGTGTTTPASWLHIITSGSTNNKEPFRTEVPSSTESNWRMLKGTSSMMRLWNPAGGNDIFLQTPQGGLKIGTYNGAGSILEAMHVVGGSGSNKAYVGIGDYSAFTPNRKLDVYDAAGGPQLRLTYTGSTTVGSATIYSDFQTLSTGDLYINPMNSSNPKGVGIGTTTFPNFSKLAITGNVPTTSTNVQAVNIESIQTSTVIDNYGVRIYAEGATDSVTGVDINIDNSTPTIASVGLQINNSSDGTSGSAALGINTKVDGTSNFTNCGMQIKALNALSDNLGSYIEVGDIATYTGSGNNVGIRTITGNGATAIGFEGEAQYSLTSNTGVSGTALGLSNSTSTNIGVSGTANFGTISYGIYGTVNSSSCANGGPCAKAAGYFNGAVFTTLAAYYTGSDLRIKKNIQPMTNATAILNSLQPKSFEFDTLAIPQMNMSEGNHYGLIAQEVEQLLPTLVKDFIVPAKYDSTGNLVNPMEPVKSVAYTELIPFLIQGFKEQQQTIDSLRNVLGGGIPRPNNNLNPNSQRIELSDNQGIIINQNDPNPWSESTTITYSIPTSVKDARIMFTDNRGTVLRSAKIESRGEGSLDVYASELSSGIYTYTLICDGKVIESKKMMKM